jgi:hypothetical protein
MLEVSSSAPCRRGGKDFDRGGQIAFFPPGEGPIFGGPGRPAWWLPGSVAARQDGVHPGPAAGVHALPHADHLHSPEMDT